IFIDGPAHVPECRSKLKFLFPFDRVAGQRHRQTNQDANDHHGHYQFDECKTVMPNAFHGAETFTCVVPPVDVFCCASRMRKSVIRKVEFPGRARSRTRVTRFPVPETGADPGGLSREIRSIPFSVSIRWTKATICPSRLRNPPSRTSRTLKAPGSN